MKNKTLIVARKIKKIAKYFLAKHLDINIQIPIENEIFFCFAGEFGYELISWIPYLIFLKKTTGIKINSISRPGSSVFYYFSDRHLEGESEDITGMWGNKKAYKKIAKKLGIKKMVHTCNEDIGKQTIKINNYEWTTKNIHTKINETNYMKPDFSGINDPLPFDFEKYVVINNKYTKFKNNDFSPNFFDSESLQRLKSLLLEKGYSVVYNRFIEKTATDVEGDLKDAEIFDQGNCYDMQDFYSTNTDPHTQNKIQISMYNKASFVIGVQGGNIYIPSFCRKNILMLMRDGDYVDYTELARLFGISMDVFYEPKHLLLWLDNNLENKTHGK